MGRKELERMMGKLHSVHHAVPGAVAHLYHVQRALSQGGGVDQACLLPESHCNMVDWRALVVKTSARLTHMAEISRREHTHLGFCNA